MSHDPLDTVQADPWALWLSERTRTALDLPQLPGIRFRRAAVLVALTRESDPRVLLTVRSGDLPDALLDVALAADFEESGRIFFSFAEPREGGNGTALASAILVLDEAGGGALEDVSVIFSQEPTYDGDKHFGSRIVPAPDGTLFLTVGERSDRPIRDKAELARIRSLAIPPAYADVSICADPEGHIQATGRDAKGRKQYRYHPEWRTCRDATKYDRLLRFAAALPLIERADAANNPIRTSMAPKASPMRIARIRLRPARAVMRSLASSN